MEKLVRNTLASKQIIFDDQNNKIEWKYLEALYNCTKENDLRAHKLTKKHMQWSRNIMNVCVAVETMSGTVADSMEIAMKQNHPEFEGAAATIKFIRIMNTLFDIFNSRHSKCENIYKRELSDGNLRIVADFFEKTTRYLKGLQIEVVRIPKRGDADHVQVIKIPILESRNKTGFRGFIVDITSVMEMYKDFVEGIGSPKTMSSIATYYLQQDKLDMFFGKIRSCGGFNNNPNVNQFKGAYRKVLGNCTVVPSNKGNCRAFDDDLPGNLYYSDIYLVSSRRARFVPTESAEFAAQFEEQSNAILRKVVEKDAEFGSRFIDCTSNFAIAHIASKIEQKIIRCPELYCNSCKTIFQENQKIDASIDGGLLLWKPCTSTMDICKTAERFFKTFDVRKHVNQFDFRVTYCLIFRAIDFSKIYPDSAFACDPHHKYQFVKCIVGQ